MKKKKLISLALSALMLAGSVLPVMADEPVVLGAATLSELAGYEKICTTNGVDLYVDKETGDVEFVLDGKVLFAADWAARHPVTQRGEVGEFGL